MDEEELIADAEEENTSLGLSDEEFMALPDPSFEPEEDSDPEVEEPIEEVEEELIEDDTELAEEEPVASPEEEVEEPVTDSKEETEEPVELNYKEEYDKVMSPLKANGKTVNIDNIDDLRALASMGMDYNRKMVAIKPYRLTAKKLENNGITDEKLDYLIDLSKGNPDAIQRLLKESKIDPLDMDLDKDTAYSPNAYTVDDKEVELDAVLEDIRETPAFSSTIDIISNKWDESSKRVLLGEPAIIKVINEHVASGIYAQINTVIESERMMGRLTGLSDIEAYKQVGDAIQSRGGFTNNEQPTQVTELVKPTTVNRAATDPKLNDRKKATSTTKAAPTKVGKTDYNPLSMSDEEFEQEINSKYI